MITGVTGVTRSGGIDMPTPARTAVPSPASADDAPAPASSSATGKADGAAAGLTKPAAAGQQDARSDQETADSGAAAATSRYLAELLAARVIGGAAPSPRPAQITPERLTSLISFLESNGAPAGTADPATRTGTGSGVDVTS